MKQLAIFVLVLCACAVALAQAPQGWKLRLDRSTSASDPDAKGQVQFTVSGRGFHAVNPVAAVFWNPARSVTGSYTLKGTFTLLRPSSHVNYYGLVFGGTELEGEAQSYLYFMVAQDGTWLLKRRNRTATQELSDKAPSNAVKRPDASGRSTNALEVRVDAQNITLLINGTTVDTRPKSGRAGMTDGTYGIRINHDLDVQVDDFALVQ